MRRFWHPVIEPALEALQPESVVEIGSDEGGNTGNLLDFCRSTGAKLHVIDPLPKYEISDLQEDYGENLVFHEDLSLNALPLIDRFDAVLIDGDHNWYTVFNELKLIEQRCRDLGQPFPLVMLHDVAWPYGRRDLYYAPETIPEEYRRPYERKGMRLDTSELVERGGLNADLCNASREGEPRSGVLTAVEDFQKQAGKDLSLQMLPGLNGLGILFPPELKESNRDLAKLLDDLELTQKTRQLVEIVERDRLDTETRRQEYRAAVQRLRNRRDTELATFEARLEAKEREIERFRQNTATSDDNEEAEQLASLLEQLDSEVSFMLSSRRWKVGYALGKIMRRLLGRPSEPTVPVGVQRVRDQLAARPTARVQSHREAMPVPKNEQEPVPRESPESKARVSPSTDVVICVHNALEDVRRCLESVAANTPEEVALYLVNDGSDAPTSQYLAEFASRRAPCVLLENASPKGYTRAANAGLRASGAEYVVLLNSDTIVPSKWLERLVECGESDPAIGIIGPLSNAASWQSVPEISAGGDWAVNPLPAGYSVDAMARLVESCSEKRFPRVPFINGFCFVVKRSLLETVGYLDEESFPEGYGEENDYSLRAADAGFEIAVADHAYVYHAKSKSYSHERRHALRKPGGAALKRKHGEELVARGVKAMREEPTLKEMRERIRNRLSTTAASSAPADSPLSVLFLLPSGGVGGGVHSIIQEAGGMREIGIFAQVAVPEDKRDLYRQAYPAIDQDVFHFFDSSDALIETAQNFAVAVATTFRSVELLKDMYARNPSLLPAYYIQDYEPWFARPGSTLEEQAKDSYTLIPDAIRFAKTDWIRETVRNLHGVEVSKVSPSLDHSVYYPNFEAGPEEVVRVTAMVRPKTPRRAAKETMQVLESLKKHYGDAVTITIFGCEPDDSRFLALPRGFEFENREVLVREEVAELLRESDIFLDLSKYQAFGRTGLEAMACGCAVVLPENGGASEYAKHRENALLVDTSDFDKMVSAAKNLVDDGGLREELSIRGTMAASVYSVRRAVVSELTLFQTALQERASHVDDPRTTNGESG